MEGGCSDTKFPLHRLHHLPQLPPWVSGRTRYRDRNPQGQTDSEGFSHEGSGPPYDLPGPVQGIRCLGQAHVPGNPGGIWRGAQVPPPPLTILGEASDGGAGGGGTTENYYAAREA